MPNKNLDAFKALARCCGFEFPNHFKEWFSLVEDYKRLLMIASRDHGKTTFFSKLLPIFSVISKIPEILLVSYSDKQVLKIASGTKELCETQEILKSLKPDFGEDWSKSILKFANGSRMDTLTFGSSGRGGHYDLVIVDDPVKDYGGMDPDEQEDYFKRVLTPMVKPDGQMIVTGNFVYEGDLIERIEKNPAYHVGFYPAISNGKALWQERWPIEKLDLRRAEVGEYSFAREYLLQKISPGTQFFKRSQIKYYDPNKMPDRFFKLGSIDPAISVDGDDSAMVVTGTGEDRKTYLLDFFNFKTDNVRVVIDEIFRLVKKWSIPYIQVETIGFQKMLKHWLYEAMRQNNYHFGIEEIRTHRKSKEARIMALQPRIESGSLLFHPTENEKIISQLLAFPQGAYDDLIDALSFQVGKWDNPGPIADPIVENSFEWWKSQSRQQEKNWQESLNV